MKSRDESRKELYVNFSVNGCNKGCFSPSVPLICCDLSDLGSLILISILIVPVESTLFDTESYCLLN